MHADKHLVLCQLGLIFFLHLHLIASSDNSSSMTAKLICYSLNGIDCSTWPIEWVCAELCWYVHSQFVHPYINSYIHPMLFFFWIQCFSKTLLLFVTTFARFHLCVYWLVMLHICKKQAWQQQWMSSNTVKALKREAFIFSLTNIFHVSKSAAEW